MTSLGARAHGCLPSSSLTTKTFPTGLLPARQSPASVIARVNLPQGHKLDFFLLAFHEVPTNMCRSSSWSSFLEQVCLGDLFSKDSAQEGIEYPNPICVCGY